MINDLWYKNAIIYCLSVGTFIDANGDGIGDFHGLLRRLDYLQGLGITAIWLMPFQPSPHRDDGYDVADYYGVDPRYGTLGDFVEFTQGCRQRGLRVLIDLVVNHTSDEHPWFQDARKDPKSKYRDWYVWSKRKPRDANKGMVFPGVQKSTWNYDPVAKEWYFHRFYDFQPDLNTANPEVRAEILKIMGFWLQLGVSGFRMDAVPFVISKKGLDHFSMRYFALACDYDGTIAHEGVVAPSTIEALQRLKESGRRPILVTGRQLDELLQVFPEFAIFERIVADNGAVLYSPATRETKVLAEPPPSQFTDALRNRGVPFSAGQVIVGTVEPYDAVVLEVIKELGLELQVIYNKGSVMVLPSGVNKSTGLAAALAELNLSPHNSIAIGDAENDHALLSLCEIGVAVANAIPTLIDRADFTTTLPDGSGVEQLIERILHNDLAGVEPRRTDRQIALGKQDDTAVSVSIKPYGASFVIAGPSGSGKTTVVRAIIERLVRNTYQICLIDPEGDYDELEKFVALGSANRPPELAEISQLLNDPQHNVSVNLLGIALPDRPLFFSKLFPKLQELRSSTGRPHWIIIDEAHHLIPKSWDPVTGALPEKLSETILVTVQVDSVHPAALKSMTGIVAVGPSPELTVQQFSEAIGIPSPVSGPLLNETGFVYLWRVSQADGLVRVKVDPPAEDVRRHKRKYAGGELPPGRSFYFKGPEGKLNLRAQNLNMFIQIAEGVDDETWNHHLRHRDFSSWMRENIKDEELVAEVSSIENAGKSAQESRSRVIEAINKRYTAPE